MVLPQPDMEPKKRRGGRRYRKMKERYGLTGARPVPMTWCARLKHALVRTNTPGSVDQLLCMACSAHMRSLQHIGMEDVLSWSTWDSVNQQ